MCWNDSNITGNAVSSKWLTLISDVRLGKMVNVNNEFANNRCIFGTDTEATWESNIFLIMGTSYGERIIIRKLYHCYKLLIT